MTQVTTPEPSPDDILRLYRKLRLIRRVEEEVARVYPTDKIKSPVHLSIGQEAISVAICDVLNTDDTVGMTYRSHAAFLAKGENLKGMLAEMYGKVTGCSRGKGGSMHLIDMEHQILGASAVVGTSIPLTVGYALALKRENKGRVAVCFFGDGATEEGVFYESLNFAALHKLPILFVCENNFFAIHTPLEKRWAAMDICARVEPFGLPARKITTGDIFEIHKFAKTAVEKIRNGDGPQFVECQTYRWREHVGPNEDYDSGYRDRADAKAWMDNDQVPRLAAMVPDAERSEIDAAIETLIAEGFAFAEESPFPGPEELLADVFAR